MAAERALGLQPAPFMEAKDQSIQCHMEASFIQTVARPLWEGLAIVLPALGPAVRRMAVNSDIYMALAQLAPHKISKVCALLSTLWCHARMELWVRMASRYAMRQFVQAIKYL